MANRGRRYDGEEKLNIKKVIGVIVAFAVIIMVIVSLVNILNDSNKTVEVVNYTYYTAYDDGKFGVINNEGQVVINIAYHEIIAIPNSSKPIFLCTYDVSDEAGTYRTKAINENNEEILTGYEKIEIIDNYDSKQNIWYEENVLRVRKNGKYGLIDYNGEVVLPCEYDEITALKGVKSNLIVKKDGNVGLVNEKGQTIIGVQYKDIRTLKEGYKNEYIIIDENNKYGLINTSGIVLIEPKYEDLKYLNNSTLFAVKESGIWKLIDTEENKILIDKGYSNIVEAKSDNIVVVDGKGKYGIVTKSNEKKIDMQYEDLKYAFSIYYIAKKNGKYGIIDTENKTIVDFEYMNMTYIENGGFIVTDKTETETVVLDNNLAQKIAGIISEINIDKAYIRVYDGNDYKYYNFKLEEKKSSDILTDRTLFLSKQNGKYGYVNKEGTVVVDYIYEDGTEQNSSGYVAVKKNGLWGSLNKVGAVSQDTTVNLDNNLYIDFVRRMALKQ